MHRYQKNHPESGILNGADALSNQKEKSRIALGLEGIVVSCFAYRRII